MAEPFTAHHVEGWLVLEILRGLVVNRFPVRYRGAGLA